MTSPAFGELPYLLGAHIEARASHPQLAEKPFLFQGDRCWTYRRYRNECVRLAHFLLARLGAVDESRPGNVAVLLENHLELLSLYGACGYAGLTLFGVNTGLRGDTLAGVLNQSRARVLIVDQRFLPEVERVRSQLKHVSDENFLVLKTSEVDLPPQRDLRRCVEVEIGAEEVSLPAPERSVDPTANLMVIYTSGTTGLPKGINNNHLKFLLVGRVIGANLALTSDDVGYACMPLFHSNAMFLAFVPVLLAGASLVLRERFSASQFFPDVLRYGVTYWNYVGEPAHYILQALEKQYGSEERVLAEVARHPQKRLRCAVGNGASPRDQELIQRWLGLEDVYELYGSTEAAISSFRRKGDPRGSVGEVTDPRVQIMNEKGEACPPAELDADGKITNYAEAVGEICRVAPDTALFQGYYDNPEADAAKFRDGVYHSGDLGHILVHNGKRYLFFDGRTEDWIRKDGENFSAAPISLILQEHSDVLLAATYGVPCPVSDEWVMVSLKLRPGAAFDPQEFFDFCEKQVVQGSMDRKWFPDFVRVVEDFEYTQTQKILVRNLKKVHFDSRRLPPETALFWRRRGDTAFRPFGSSDFESLCREFEASERIGLLNL